MTGLFWHIFIFIVLFIFLVLIIFRILFILRLPVHLRWELAPVLHEEGKKSRYGGSYLEEYEWWRKKRRKSYLAVISYMAGEIFLMKGVWKNNRGLWPFSLTLHTGLYLVIISIVLHFINAMFIITGTSVAVLDVFKGIAAIVAIASYILGSLGAVGLILKRSLDTDFRTFSSFSTFFRLGFLAVLFISGIVAWFTSVDFATEMNLFTRALFTLDSGITATLPVAIHILVVFLFLAYLPFTDMTHFITKFFTYHSVRWDDEPKNRKMESRLGYLTGQPLNWSAAHIKADGKKNWVELTTEKFDGDKEA